MLTDLSPEEPSELFFVLFSSSTRLGNFSLTSDFSSHSIASLYGFYFRLPTTYAQQQKARSDFRMLRLRDAGKGSVASLYDEIRFDMGRKFDDERESARGKASLILKWARKFFFRKTFSLDYFSRLEGGGWAKCGNRWCNNIRSWRKDDEKLHGCRMI